MRRFPELSAAEAASFVQHGQTVGCSGFTGAGSPKTVTQELAGRARSEHDLDRDFRIRLITGASTGRHVDEALSDAHAISWRTPFQSSRHLRQQINTEQTQFLDLHLSQVPMMVERGFLGEVDIAVIEAGEVTSDGRVYLTTSSGVAPTLLCMAKKVILEINDAQSHRLREMHDVVRLADGVLQMPSPLARIGQNFAQVDPAKIIGLVRSNERDDIAPFTPPTEASAGIAQHIADFLAAEQRAGRIPRDFLPIQAGVGNVSNAVLTSLGTHPDIPPFVMFTEVVQDGQVELLRSGRVLGASTCAVMFSQPVMQQVFDDMDFFAPRIVMRPQEISNNPSLILQFSVISINTAIEMDIYGNANSTHVGGTHLLNGIGGSGDFVRNSYLSIMMAPSVAKGGAISSIVPMVTHCDHNEHSLDILVTDQGLADLRGLGPHQRAERIIDRCAHPDYRDYLRKYVADASPGHLRHDLSRCFELHRNYQQTGRMLP